MASNLFPAGDPRAALIYANAMAPLAEIPGDVFQGIMQSREQTRLEEVRRDQERARREGRRKTKRTEFLEAVAAAEAPTATARPTTTTAGGGAAPTAGPMYTTTMGPGGHEMVAGMEFGPGMGSPEDITLASVRPARETTVGGLEERRAAGRALEQLGRFTERRQGADPTIQERAEEIVRGYGIDSQNAIEVAVRESLGEPTPAFDKLVLKKAEKEGFVSPEGQERVGGLDPEAARWFEPSAGGRGASILAPAPTKKENLYQRAMDAPEQPYGDPYLTPMASALREGSQVMSAVLEGDYLGDQTPERTMQARAYERFVRELGDEEAAEELKRIRKIAWAQQAREKKRFMAAMTPNLGKVGIPNPEDVAELYWDDPEQGKTVYSEAASAYRQVLANNPRVREENEKREQAKQLGKEAEAGINRRAMQYLDDSHANISGLIKKRSKETHEDSLELEEEARTIISRQRIKPPAGRTIAQQVQLLLDDRSGAVSDEDKVALGALDDRMKNLEARENHLNIDNAVLVEETAALKRGETPENIEVSVGGKKYIKRALSADGELSFDLDGLENQNAATVYGGKQFLRSTATAAGRRIATEGQAYLDPSSATPTTRSPTPSKVTPPTDADLSAMARLLRANEGYTFEGAKASAERASINPAAFWGQMSELRRKGKEGKEEIPTGLPEDEVEVRDEDIYLEGSESRAWDDGWRKKVEKPGDTGMWVDSEGDEATHADVLTSFK